jgi:TPR repeat protein
MGYLYYIGQPIKDYNKAILWFKLAVKAGDAYSKKYLDPASVLTSLKNQSYYDVLIKTINEGK